ncbi:hypothetical protein ACFSR8_16390 [Hyunsoonleella rubra]|uniref:Uncharacterized protein n=2 Tax=Hyunsoonleella rubra TaxID=1737062 RepID=A0ABW5TFI7_9FLAO
MLLNITLLILSLIALNVLFFSFSYFKSAKKRVLRELNTPTEAPIKLNTKLEVESESRDLAPTGS